MAQNKPFVVELLEPEQMKYFLSIYGKKACCCYNTDFSKAESVARACIKTAHFSPSRGQHIEFIIKDIPRSCADQIVRHGVGTSPAMMSFRYVDVARSAWYTPSAIKDSGCEYIYDKAMLQAREDYNCLANTLRIVDYTDEQAQEAARGIINMNTLTNLAIGMTLEAIINFCSKRLCNRAEEAISEIATKIAQITIREIPEMKKYLKAPCIRLNSHDIPLWNTNRCPEGKMCCARKPKYLMEDYR